MDFGEKSPKSLHKYLDMKELHFYTNLCNEEQVSDWDLETMATDYTETVKQIKDKDRRIVKTTQLCFLVRAWDYIEMGYKLYLHNGVEVREIKEGMDAAGEAKRGVNLLMCLLNGWFGEIS